LRGRGSLRRKHENTEELILRVLRELGEANINAIRRKTGLNYYLLIKVLESLVSRGVVVERRIGRLRVFATRLTGGQRTA
jgi:predicted transcriptional regulator